MSCFFCGEETHFSGETDSRVFDEVSVNFFKGDKNVCSSCQIKLEVVSDSKLVFSELENLKKEVDGGIFRVSMPCPSQHCKSGQIKLFVKKAEEKRFVFTSYQETEEDRGKNKEERREGTGEFQISFKDYTSPCDECGKRWKLDSREPLILKTKRVWPYVA